ncbi:class E sortase [Streptomyces griseus]|uniref:class E sortase n=1 Tax=Streptomyces griseus TaxID=1911 RepID=UPI0004CBF247|nr:class E sortase [Streptomyces griseus]
MTTGSPWFRASEQPGPEPIPQEHGPGPYEQGPYGQTPYEQGPYDYGQQSPQPYPYPSEPGAAYGNGPAYGQGAPHPAAPAPQEPAYDSIPEPYEPAPEPYGAVREPYGAAETREMPEVTEGAPGPVEPLPGPGRAERRRAAAKQGRGRGRRGAAPQPGAGSGPAADDGGRPLSRVEARRAARREAKAAKDTIGVVVGELFITLGVVMLLFVAYQLWWTNVLAGQETNQAKAKIEDTWAKGESKPDVFAPGEGFAIMYIPKLDVVVPVAEGISKPKVLDKGMVGHYGEGKLKTAMPSDKKGNFAVAGHRNTHGEPFRYINRLEPGDPIVVETQDAYYTYEMASILPQTSPSNISVIDPVPKGSGFTGPGRYITLTTCTPEFTSTYRMIVWGKLVEERPRSKGKPSALVG